MLGLSNKNLYLSTLPKDLHSPLLAYVGNDIWISTNTDWTELVLTCQYGTLSFRLSIDKLASFILWQHDPSTVFNWSGSFGPINERPTCPCNYRIYNRNSLISIYIDIPSISTDYYGSHLDYIQSQMFRYKLKQFGGEYIKYINAMNQLNKHITEIVNSFTRVF